MATELPTRTNGTAREEVNGVNDNGSSNKNKQDVKEGLARMLKGGVIMDVVDAEQVKATLSLPAPFSYDPLHLIGN